MRYLKRVDYKIYRAICNEIKREDDTLELIASENFASEAVLEATGSALTNKYAEGYPGARWYGGCKYIDEVERLAIERAKELFSAEHANVQPHSGTQANMAVYFAAVKPEETILAMDLACGGHLTHGHPVNFSGRLYKVVTYGVSSSSERLDYDEISRLARRFRPKLIIAGASAYPRIIDFKRFRKICDSVGAYLFVDMAHIAGLVAAGVHQSPVPYADFVTSTTHKTLRGPRGGFILCRKQFAKEIDSQVFPGTQGGPLMHVIAAKAVCFKEALRPNFKTYQRQVVKNARALSDALSKKGCRIVSGGTDTHLLLADLSNFNLTGRDAASSLERAGITVNKNLIPFDKKSPSVTSGIRLGTPGLTTRGMKEKEILKIAELIVKVLSSPFDESIQKEVRQQVVYLTRRFPLYEGLKKC